MTESDGMDAYSTLFTDLGTNTPGTLETLHNRAHDIFPIPFNGAKLVLNKGLSQNFQVTHTVNFCSPENVGYRFGATFVGHSRNADGESYPVFTGEMQPNGNVQAQIVTSLGSLMRLRYIGQIENQKLVGQQLATDMKFGRWNTCVTVVNPDFFKKQFIAAVDVMRQITPRLALGTMCLYQENQQAPNGRDASWSLGGRYTFNKNYSLAFSSRPFHGAFHTSFHMRVNESLQLAAEFESSAQQQSNVATLGYQFDIQKSCCVFKSQIDSNFNVATTMEKKLAPFPFSFLLSAVGSLSKSRYEVGVGLTIG